MLTNFTLGVALFAGLASAESYGARPVRYVQPARYGSQVPHHNHHNTQSYGQQRPHLQYGYQPTGYQPSQQRRHQNYSSPENHHYNAWGEDQVESIDKSGWWSPYQQYRPPVIAYKAATLYEIHYATCEAVSLADDRNDIEGSIDFAQVSGHPVQLQGDMMAPFDADSLHFIIKETGLVGTDCASAAASDEFNPLLAIDKYGNPFVMQDPTRGRIDPISGDLASGVMINQDHLYQNLVGKDSIVGRAISIHLLTSAGDPFVAENQIGCCVIAIDEKPEEKAQTNVPHYGYPYSNPQPQHHKNVSTHYQAAPRPTQQAAPRTHYQAAPLPTQQAAPRTHYQAAPAPRPTYQTTQPETSYAPRSYQHHQTGYGAPTH